MVVRTEPVGRESREQYRENFVSSAKKKPQKIDWIPLQTYRRTERRTTKDRGAYDDADDI